MYQHPLLSVEPDKSVSTEWYTSFFISSVSSFNFQAFKLTNIISRCRVKFHNFTCLMSQGDSGSPLVYLEKDGKYTQVGIVSFVAVAGCELGYPASFTNVIRYLCWIAKHTGIFFCFCPWNLWHKEWSTDAQFDFP